MQQIEANPENGGGQLGLLPAGRRLRTLDG
jgi:hypothetical protein